MVEPPGPPGFEHDRLDPESHVVDAENDPLLIVAEAHQARRAAIIDRLLQACVFAVYALGIGVVVLAIAFLGVSRRADQVVKNQRHEAVFREQVRAALTCLTDRSRCSNDQLRNTLDALALNRVPPPIPPVSPTTRPPRPATTVAPSRSTMPSPLPGVTRPPATTAPPPAPSPPNPPPSPTTTPPLVCRLVPCPGGPP